MKGIVIEIETENAAFSDDFEEEITMILQQAKRKIMAQMTRPPCLCDAPEDVDVLLDSNGNTVGVVRLEEMA